MIFEGEVVGVAQGDWGSHQNVDISVAGLNGDRRVMEVVVPWRLAHVYYPGRRVRITIEPKP
jgi:hypothetical protein